MGADPIEEHIQDETDAEFLYRALADLEVDPDRRASYSRLAEVEGLHRARWIEHGRENQSGGGREAIGPSFRARALAWLARRFGPRILVPMLRVEEAREVASYLEIAQRAESASERATAAELARDSADHAAVLGGCGGSEPWHGSAGAGGVVRSVVYGFNDGLTANFGLLAGVLGASGDPRVLAMTGIVGAFADALSMGASGYLAAKSEAEVHAREIAMERREIEVMPDLERAELAARYRSRGVDQKTAEEMAARAMTSPVTALKEEVRDELEIGAPDLAPLKDGIITGTATLVGALIPLVPIILVPSLRLAATLSFSLSMLSHFGVGAARSFFTGRGVLRSGFDMFLVGLGVGGAGHLLGKLIERLF